MGVLKIKIGEDNNGNSIWKNIDKLSLNTINSISADEKTSIKIQDGKLLINDSNLADYLSENTSACKVGGANEPTKTEINKTGDLYVQVTGNYSILWYFNGNEWVRMNSIWG